MTEKTKTALTLTALVALSIILAIFVYGNYTIRKHLYEDIQVSPTEAVSSSVVTSLTSIPIQERLDMIASTQVPTEEPQKPEPDPEPVDDANPESGAVVLSADEQPSVAQPEYGRYGSMWLSADEIETLARIVKLEAGGECFEGQQAVAEVVLNRVLSPSFPNNVYDVIYEEDQFSPASEIPYTSASQTQYDAVNAALSGQNILPQQVCYFARSQNGRTQVWGWIGAHCFCY